MQHVFFLSAIWFAHCQLWVISEGTALPTQEPHIKVESKSSDEPLLEFESGTFWFYCDTLTY